MKLGDLSVKVFQSKNNPMNMIAETQLQQRLLARAEKGTESLDAGPGSAPGDMVDGRFISPDTMLSVDASGNLISEPTASGFYGAYQSGRGELFVDAIAYQLGTVYNGAPNYGEAHTIVKWGSDITAPNTTALSVFKVPQTYNSESMNVGALLMGSNSTSKANLLWDPTTGRINFRGGLTVQAYIDTDGTIGFGGGAGSLSVSGEILQSNTYPSAALIQWKSADTNVVTGELISDYGGAAVNTGLRIIGQAHDAGVRGYAAMWANDSAGVTRGALTVDSNGSSTFDHTGTTGIAGANSLLIRTKTSATNAGSTLLKLYLDSSGTPAAGLGPVIDFFAKNSAGAVPNIGSLSIAYNDPTSTSEDTVFGISLMVAGALATVLSLDGVRGMTLSAPLSVGGPFTIKESTTPSTPASGYGAFYPKSDNNPYFINDAGTERQLATGSGTSTGTNTGDQTLKTPLGGNALAGTIALSSTMYVAPYYPAVPTASEANVQFPAPFTGSLKNMRFRLTGAQPATGTLVITLRIAATNTTITITIAAGATAGTYSDLTHTENITAGQLISIACVNNALGVSGTIGAFSIEYDAA